MNRLRITCASFFAYFVMSGVLAPIGIVSAPMAAEFGLSLTDMTSRFAWLTLGILLGAGLAVPLLQAIRLRTILVVVYLLIGLVLFGLRFVGVGEFINLLLGVIGVGAGVGLAAAAAVISRAYAAQKRASALVITDGFFSMAGYVCAALAAALVAQSLHWSWVYVFIGIVAMTTATLAYVSDFPEYTTADAQANERSGVWPRSALICLIALAFYTLAQSSILLWLPHYAQERFELSAEAAGGLIGSFWLGMFVGQLLVAFSVLRTGVHAMLWLALVGTLVGSVSLWLVRPGELIGIVVFLWGVANLGLLKLVISLAAEFTLNPSPRLLSSLLFGATAGTAVGPLVSSQLVEWAGYKAPLQFASGLYCAMFLIMAYVLLRNRASTPVLR